MIGLCNCHFTEKQLAGVYKKFAAKRDEILTFITIGFLPDKLKNEYSELVRQRFDRLKPE